MADRKLSGVPSPSLSSPSHRNGRIGSPPPHHPSNTSVVAQPPSASSSPLRTRGGRPGPEDSHGSSRPRGQSLASVLSSWTRTMTPRSKRRSSQQEEPEALLDLILECQGQRLEDQRASLSLLPDPGPAALCGACSPDQPTLPGLDFYYMLIHYQSDRMEDQRCSLPDLEDMVGSGSEGQEDFFSLVQRVQSRRMDEQRASLLQLTHIEDDHTHTEDNHTAGSSPHHRHHLHH